MAARHSLTVSVTVRSPFLFRGLAGGLTGVDSGQLRDEAGAAILPADQMRGVLREACGDLVAAGALDRSWIDAFFGSASGEREGASGEADQPARGRLIFGDLTARGMRAAADTPEQALPRAGGAETTRVEIDDETGTAKAGALQVMELVAPFGALVRFTGEIVAFAPTEERRRIETVLGRAIDLVASIGSFKSPGFGEVVEASIRASGEPARLALPAQPATGPHRRLYRVTFDRPVLVDSQNVADNAFQGSAILPGGAFKGALARRLDLAHAPGQVPDDLAGTLSALSFSHAVPESRVPGQAIAHALPFSLVAAKVGETVRFADVSAMPRGAGALLAGEVASFQPDWKDAWWPLAAEALGLADGDAPPLLARTHTKILNGVAEEGKLFTTIARAARRRSNGSDDAIEACAWLISLDVSACADTAAAGRLVAAVEQGLDGIGKTAARATFHLIGEAPVPERRAVTGRPDRHVIVLTSDALMVDPVAATCADGSAWSLDAHDAYAQYWATALPGARLYGTFTRERWAGAYLSFRRRLYGGGSYHPFLVTQAGSTFVLDGADRDALDRLCRFGLPLPALRHAGPLTWRTCPFVPENGYGRIRADHGSDAERAAALSKDVAYV